MLGETIKKSIFSFIGSPGSGKSFISRKCVENLGFSVLSTGDLCRKHISLQTDFGKSIQKCLNEGKLVSDEIMTNAVADWFTKEAIEGRNIVLDGYPRTKGQADLFVNILDELKLRDRLLIVNFIIDEDVAIKHLSKRVICENIYCQAVYSLALKNKLCAKCGSSIIKRSDDDISAILERIKKFPIYRDVLLKFYFEAGIDIVDFCVDNYKERDTFLEFKDRVL